MNTVMNRSFQKHLAVIVDKLAKAALVEIGNLADDYSSILHTEISQHKAENEALKKKCFLLEIQLRAARNTEQNTPSCASRMQNGNHCMDRFPREPPPTTELPPTIEGVFGQDWCMDLWREERVSHIKDTVSGTLKDKQGIDLVDGEPDLIFVKEELSEDRPVGTQIGQTDSRKSSSTLEGDSSALQRAVNDLPLYQGDLNTFIMTDGSLQEKDTPPESTDQRMIDPTQVTQVDNSAHSSATSGEYYPNNPHLNTATELVIHQRTGKAQKQFECLFCGKVFNYLSSLKVHIRGHSGEKPFSCTVCGKRFAQKTYLKLHQRVHSGEKPYSCQQCGKSFSQKSSLNIHIRTHTGEKPYSCVDCGKSYAYKYGFNQHQCFS